jgi:hypothetical protein
VPTEMMKTANNKSRIGILRKEDSDLTRDKLILKEVLKREHLSFRRRKCVELTAGYEGIGSAP